MYHLYTEINQYGLERQKLLLGEQRPERISLSDGRMLNPGQWLHRATEWLVDQLAFVGKSLPCVDNDLACDIPFTA